MFWIGGPVFNLATMVQSATTLPVMRFSIAAAALSGVLVGFRYALPGLALRGKRMFERDTVPPRDDIAIKPHLP